MTPLTRWSPLVIAIFVRAASLFYLLVVHPLTVSPQGAFDTSTSILLALSPAGTSPTSDGLSKALEPFVKWDNLYFAQIAVRGYQHEQELAFMPVWPLVMRWSGMVIQKLRLLLAIGSSTQSQPGSSQTGVLLGINDVVLGGVIVTNIVSVLNVVAFQKLTYRVTKNPRYTTLCTILYALHPAPAISSVPYTEPFYTLCTFMGSRLVLLTSGSSSSSSPNSSDLGQLDGPTFTSGVNSNSSSRLRSSSKRVPYGPTITRRRIKHLLLRTLGITCLMLSSGTRSLGVLNSVLIVWPLLVRLYEYRLRGFFTTLRLALWAGIECILVGSPFAAFQYYAYQAFCANSNTNTNPGSDHRGMQGYSPGKQRRPWCDHRLPLAYNYVQGHYWDVGFLRYWTFSQIPNFVLVAPILVASIYGIYRYWQLVFRRFTRSKTTTTVSSSSQSRLASTRSRSRSKSSTDPDLDLDLDLELRQTLWENPDAAPFFLIHTITTLILVFASHTQIALRVSMGNPVLFWIVGAFVSSSSSNSSRKYRRGGRGGGGGDGGRTAKWARRGIVWSCTWGAVSLVLWAGFYPPA